MKWREVDQETRLECQRRYQEDRSFNTIIELAGVLKMNPHTLLRRIQEMNAGIRPRITKPAREQFPDKKQFNSSFEDALEQIRNSQSYKEKKSVSQDEATWIPDSMYPDLPISVTWMCDIHFGSLETDYDLLEDHLRTIQSTPNMYIIFGGDEIDNFNAIKYPSGIWSDGISPEDQMIAWSSLLEDLDEQSKIAAMVWGNHTNFTDAAGINPYSAFFSHVSCPIFAEGGGVLNVQLEHVSYRLGIRHTFWGGSKLNKTNSPKRMIQFGYPNLDVGMLGHVHDAAGEIYSNAGEDKIAIIGGTYKVNDAFRKKWAGSPDRAGFTVVLWPHTKKMLLFREPSDAKQYILGLTMLGE